MHMTIIMIIYTVHIIMYSINYHNYIHYIYNIYIYIYICMYFTELNSNIFLKLHCNR